MATASVERMVRWARKRAGMTQHDLARALDMPQPSISRIESGAVSPKAETLIAILRATGHELAVEPHGPGVDLEAIRRRLLLDVPMRTRQSLGRTAANARTSPTRILRRLRRFGVPFILVGELAEAAHGAPNSVGRIIEVCSAQNTEAAERLALALDDLGATSSDRVEYATSVGRLRVLAATAAGDDYELLMRNAVRVLVDTALLARVAALDDLIRIRRAYRTPENLDAAAALSAIGDEPGGLLRSRQQLYRQ